MLVGNARSLTWIAGRIIGKTTFHERRFILFLFNSKSYISSSCSKDSYKLRLGCSEFRFAIRFQFLGIGDGCGNLRVEPVQFLAGQEPRSEATTTQMNTRSYNCSARWWVRQDLNWGLAREEAPSIGQATRTVCKQASLRGALPEDAALTLAVVAVLTASSSYRSPRPEGCRARGLGVMTSPSPAVLVQFWLSPLPPSTIASSMACSIGHGPACAHAGRPHAGDALRAALRLRRPSRSPRPWRRRHRRRQRHAPGRARHVPRCRSPATWFPDAGPSMFLRTTPARTASVP